MFKYMIQLQRRNYKHIKFSTLERHFKTRHRVGVKRKKTSLAKTPEQLFLTLSLSIFLA